MLYEVITIVRWGHKVTDPPKGMAGLPEHLSIFRRIQMKKFFVICSAILFTLSLSGYALAFHDGGVAHCDGCHSMHNGSGNARFVAAGPSLTNGSDASSTCLNCHNGNAGYHIASTDGSNKNERNNFV